jgi:hypothetical protein
MTNFRENTQNNINAFVDVTKSEVFIVKPCGTINKIENSSFEAPEYHTDGTLRQYNWSYNEDSVVHRAYPFTYNHAYSGSFACKARMTTTNQSIAYGKTRGIQRTTKDDHHDILSFYCYCAEDGPTYSVKNTNQLYSPLIASRQVEFILKIYGMTTQTYQSASLSPTELYSKTFTLESIAKDNPGDVSNGVSGTKTPFFYPWKRVELSIPKFNDNETYPYFYFTIGRVVSNPYTDSVADGTITTSTSNGTVNGISTKFSPRDIGFQIVTTSGNVIGTIHSYTKNDKVHLAAHSAYTLLNQSFKFRYPSFDTYFVIDGVQCEEQPTYRNATMYFDGSYEGFNTVRYPEDFQFTGEPYKSTSIRSPFTRVSGEIIDMNDYCNFYTKSIDGLATPNMQTIMHSKTLRDGQHFVEQIIQNGSITISGRIVADTYPSFVDSYSKFQEMLGKKPFNDPEPLRVFLRLQFTTGKTLLPVYFDAVYESGLEMDTKNLFQEDINITFKMISTHLQYQNDSATNMFNDSPLHDQFNTMNTDAVRDIAGFVYYNNVTKKWESPGGIGFFKVTDTTYTSLIPFDNPTGTKNQQYDTKTYYTVGDIYTVKEDKDGIVWIGGRFDMIEYDAYYINNSNNRVDVRLQVRCNNIVGIRNRQMATNAFVYPALEDFSGKFFTNGQTLSLVEAISDWQIITLVDAPTRYTQSNELSPTAFIGIPGSSSVVYTIEFTPNGEMFIGGSFDITYGGRRMVNFCSFKPVGVDAQNVLLYKPNVISQTLSNFVNTNYNRTQLQSIQGNGIYRTNWVNSAIPYVKYGTFGDEGGVGISGHSCRAIVYDYANECLYLGGDFVAVQNPDNPSTSIAAYRIARYDPVKQAFTGYTGIGGIVPTTTSYDANKIVMSLAVQYLANGTRLYMGGKWAAVGGNGAGYVVANKFGYTNSFAVAVISLNSPTSEWSYENTGGGGSNSVPVTIYDILVTKDQRVYAAGDFTELNVSVGTTKISGMAEFRYGRFIDVTRGLEANFYPDGTTAFPSVRSIYEDENKNIYLVGQFSNILNRLNVDGIARWDGKNYSGTGIYFQPAISKTLQKIYIDSSNNVLLFTGPNENRTTILRTVYTNTSQHALYGVDVLWENFPYSDIKAKFFANELDMEFLNITIDSTTGIVSYSYGIVNTAIRVGPSLSDTEPYHADEETTFIGGKFTHLRVGDSYFRCNNLVALRYDTNQHPFPYKVLVFSNANSSLSTLPLVYDDMIGFSNTNAIIGVNTVSNVSDGQVYSIDVSLDTHGSKKVPAKLFVGGRFDFSAMSQNGVSGNYGTNRIKNLFVIELEKNAALHDIEFNIPLNDEKNISVPYVNYANYVFVGQVGSTTNDAVFKVVKTHNFGSIRTDPKLVFVGGDFIESRDIASNGLLPTMPLKTSRVAVLPYDNYLTTTNKYQLRCINLSTNRSTSIGIGVTTPSYSANIYVKALAYTKWYFSTADANTRLYVGGRFSEYDGITNNAIGAYNVMNSTTLSISASSSGVTLNTNLSGAPVITDMDVNFNEYIAVSGDFLFLCTSTTPSVNSYNMAKIEGQTNVSTITLNAITDYFHGPNNYEQIYYCAVGVSHGTSKVQRQQLTGTFTWTGRHSGSVSNLFPDATLLWYNGTNAFVPINYAYAAPNITQSLVSVVNPNVQQPLRKLMQEPTTNIGASIEIQTSNTPFSLSIPYQNARNTLYNAAVLQEFNCYNTGTTSVYPTITLFCPYKSTPNTVTYYQVINNVTTEQSIYLGLTMSANEVIRIRTERERISVVSNQRGDITNAIINSRNFSLSNSNDAQIFRLIPGKNVITYGPSFPMQRCFFEEGIADITYNYNMNVVVPPIILSLSWSVGFNSIYDANATEINPLLLL